MPYMYRLISVSGWIWAVIVFAYLLIRPAKQAAKLANVKHPLLRRVSQPDVPAQSPRNTDEKHR